MSRTYLSNKNVKRLMYLVFLKSCHACGWVMSHVWMSHVTHIFVKQKRQMSNAFIAYIALEVSLNLHLQSQSQSPIPISISNLKSQSPIPIPFSNLNLNFQSRSQSLISISWVSIQKNHLQSKMTDWKKKKNHLEKNHLEKKDDKSSREQDNRLKKTCREGDEWIGCSLSNN